MPQARQYITQSFLTRPTQRRVIRWACELCWLQRCTRRTVLNRSHLIGGHLCYTLAQKDERWESSAALDVARSVWQTWPPLSPRVRLASLFFATSLRGSQTRQQF